MLKKLWENKLIKGSFLVLSASVFVNFGNYFYHLVMGRMLGPSDYGILASLLSLIYFLGIPSSTLALLTVKYISSFLGQGKKGVVSLFYFRINNQLFKFLLPLSFFLLIFSWPIARFLHLPSAILVSLIIFSALISLFSGINGAVLQGLLKFGQFSLLGITQVIVKLGLGALLVFLGQKVFGSVMAIFLSSLAGLALGFALVRKFLPSGKKTGLLPISKKEVFNYALPVFLSNLAMNSLYTSDILLTRHFLSPEEAGFYAGLALLGKIIFFASSPVATVMFPLVANYFEKGGQYRQVFRTSLLLVLLSSSILSLIYFFFPNLIIKILFGPSFLQASKHLPLFALFLSLYSLVSLFNGFYLSIKKTKMIFYPFLASVVQIVLISIFHQGIKQIVLISIMILALLLARLVMYYLFRDAQEK